MRDGWEIKQLGKICTKITDGSHNPPKGILHSDFAMISSQNVFNDQISFDDVRFLREEDYKNEDKRTNVREGDVLLTIVGTIGRCAVFSSTRNITLQRSVAVIRPKSDVKPRYLMYCLIGKNAELNEEAHGIAQKGLYLKQLALVPVPIPPVQEQEKIVAELDCLSGIIEKKRQQLEELDKLAQSIFYDMFGDIALNSKFFPVEKISDLGELARGVSKHRPRNAPELLGGEMPLIQTGDVANADMFIREYHSTYSALGVSQSRVWEKDTICITIAANIGNCAILSFRACFPDSVVGFIHNDRLSLIYALFVFNNLQTLLEEKARGIAQKNINLQILNELLIPVPPRGLQDLFAQKIETIEKQKELIKKSIQEAETLYNSRMDYWFN